MHDSLEVMAQRVSRCEGRSYVSVNKSILPPLRSTAKS